MNVTGSLHWKPNDVNIQNVTIPIIDDDEWENDECFIFIVYHKHIIYDNVTICIHDDDGYYFLFVVVYFKVFNYLQ